MREWEYVTNRRGYSIYRKIVNNKGVWKAIKEDTGEEKPITYDQARGYEPIDNAEAIGMQLGKLLLPPMY